MIKRETISRVEAPTIVVAVAKSAIHSFHPTLVEVLSVIVLLRDGQDAPAHSVSLTNRVAVAWYLVVLVLGNKP